MPAHPVHAQNAVSETSREKGYNTETEAQI